MKNIKLPALRLILSILLLFSLVTSCTRVNEKDFSVQSPNGEIKLTFGTNPKGGVNYSIQFKDSLVVGKSHLGLILENEDFFNSLTLQAATESIEITDTYSMAHGKRKINTYKANQKIFQCVNKAGKRLNIVFNISNDGVAFKYHFPDSSATVSRIVDEKTAFQFPAGTKAWLQPMSVAKSGWNKTNPSYEEYYSMEIPVGTPSPTDAGWVFPGLFKVGKLWVLITESGLQQNYCGARLEQASTNGKYEIGFPQQQESIFEGPVNPQSTTPWSSPWRIIAVGSLATVVESTLGTDVAEPAISVDPSFIKPGLASWSWALLKDESITYDIQKKFIDYAADMKWPYCLVDVNWDTTIGYDRISELSNYAREKSVGLILWYSSSGDWNTVPFHPKSKLLTAADRSTEFGILQKMKIAGVKVDFFGGDGQSVISYYHEILKDASRFNLLVNFHGATLPRGWQRTYPNLMTMESIKGFEFITFEQKNADVAPGHCALIPFVRNVFDPMDFTPMNLGSIPNIKRRTSAAFELALPTLFLSGIQHIAEIPEGMASVPSYVKEYVSGLPTDWDDSRFVDGYPGKYAVIARKKDSRWYVSGINATDEVMKLTLDLSFINANDGILITDGNDSQFERIELKKISSLAVKIIPKGGFVMKLE